MNRRRYLVGLGGIVALPVSGCVGTDDASEDDPEENEPDADTRDDESALNTEDNDSEDDAEDGVSEDDEGDDEPEDDTDADEDGTAPGDMEANGALEEAVLTFLEGIDQGDEEAANEGVHPESSLYLEEDSISEPGVTVYEIERLEIREVIRRQRELEGNELDEAVERMESDLEEVLAERGFDAYGHAFISMTSLEHGDEESSVTLIELDAEWLIWGPANPNRQLVAGFLRVRTGRSSCTPLVARRGPRPGE